MVYLYFFRSPEVQGLFRPWKDTLQWKVWLLCPWIYWLSKLLVLAFPDKFLKMHKLMGCCPSLIKPCIWSVHHTQQNYGSCSEKKELLSLSQWQDFLCQGTCSHLWPNFFGFLYYFRNTVNQKGMIELRNTRSQINSLDNGLGMSRPPCPNWRNWFHISCSWLLL